MAPSEGTFLRRIVPVRVAFVASMIDVRPSSSAHDQPLACGRSVLLVEDNDDIREMLRESLELSGCCTVLVARHGQEALEVLREASPLPAVIVLDLAMPVMSGQEFLAVAGRTPVLASIPVVVISAFFPEQDLLCARKLMKPVDTEQLERVIGELCPSCRELDETTGTALAAREQPSPISS